VIAFCFAVRCANNREVWDGYPGRESGDRHRLCSSEGPGAGIALALARAGAVLVVTDMAASGTRNPFEAGEAESAAGWKGLGSLIDELQGLGRRAVASVGDVGRKDDAERMVAEGLEYFGRADILVNNAGAPHGPDRDWIWKVPEEAWDEVFRVNAKGAFLMSTAVVRHLLGRKSPGRIINITSMAGRRGFPQRAAYSASKFAVTGLTQSMAQELAPYGITVNAVCPGAMETARGASRTARAAQSTEYEFAAPPPTTLIGRIGVPEDVARAVMFLAEPAASFITGESVNVSGGDLMF
jgi:NAD(P)-dependent dehydrogenase (short-subunit alcohol dehydrogenase family)